MNFPKKLQQKLTNRSLNNSLRSLDKPLDLIDFYSNDYLGFAKSQSIFNRTHQFLMENNIQTNGATGSRLISGNHELYENTESCIADFHIVEKALLYNSGYDANIGFFSSVPQRGDIILYDELSHASIRDGVLLSNAKSYKFHHNDYTHLEELLKRFKETCLATDNEIYVVTESVFSMDGDSPDVSRILQITNNYKARLIVDEAHALGVFGEKGAGLVTSPIFARIVTFGKALGCHGAAILGSNELYKYLINFSRSFIYTTGLSPHAIANIKIAYEHLDAKAIHLLHHNITFFLHEIDRLRLSEKFIRSTSSIHCCLISGNKKTKEIAHKIQNKGFNIKPILSPTVQEGKERLRFCLHSYNSEQEITAILEQLATFV